MMFVDDATVVARPADCIPLGFWRATPKKPHPVIVRDWSYTPMPGVEFYRHVQSQNIDHHHEILKDIIGLCAKGSRNDDGDLIKPTALALSKTLSVLCDCESELAHSPFPCSMTFGAAMVIDDGGLRIEWSEGDGDVYLEVAGRLSPDTKTGSYIYYRNKDAHSLDRDVTGGTLSYYLQMCGLTEVPARQR